MSTLNPNTSRVTNIWQYVDLECVRDDGMFVTLVPASGHFCGLRLPCGWPKGEVRLKLGQAQRPQLVRALTDAISRCHAASTVRRVLRVEPSHALSHASLAALSVSAAPRLRSAEGAAQRLPSTASQQGAHAAGHVQHSKAATLQSPLLSHATAAAAIDAAASPAIARQSRTAREPVRMVEAAGGAGRRVRALSCGYLDELGMGSSPPLASSPPLHGAGNVDSPQARPPSLPSPHRVILVHICVPWFPSRATD